MISENFVVLNPGFFLMYGNSVLWELSGKLESSFVVLGARKKGYEEKSGKKVVGDG
jgi:hypothetical protein